VAATASAQVLESFEDVGIGYMPPVGWLKWQEAGGRGWSNSWAGRMPMPGWMSGTNTTPPDPDGGSRMAYVTYTHGGAKTNDLYSFDTTRPEAGWVTASNLPAIRQNLAVASVNGRVYAIGGGSSPLNSVATVYVYDPVRPEAGWA